MIFQHLTQDFYKLPGAPTAMCGAAVSAMATSQLFKMYIFCYFASCQQFHVECKQQKGNGNFKQLVTQLNTNGISVDKEKTFP